jgi:hypothetical protein
LTVTDWCNRNYSKLLQAAKNISFNDELSEELLHYSLEQLLIKPNLEAIIDSGGGEFYVIRIMLNSWRSTTSPFYRIYRAHSEQIDINSYLQENDIEDEGSTDTEHIIQSIRSELSTLYWYDQKLFSLYANEGHTISSLARETKIPRTSISLTINRVRNHLKSKINPIL